MCTVSCSEGRTIRCDFCDAALVEADASRHRAVDFMPELPMVRGLHHACLKCGAEWDDPIFRPPEAPAGNKTRDYCPHCGAGTCSEPRAFVVASRSDWCACPACEPYVAACDWPSLAARVTLPLTRGEDIDFVFMLGCQYIRLWQQYEQARI